MIESFKFFWENKCDRHIRAGETPCKTITCSTQTSAIVRRELPPEHKYPYILHMKMIERNKPNFPGSVRLWGNYTIIRTVKSSIPVWTPRKCPAFLMAEEAVRFQK